MIGIENFFLFLSAGLLLNVTPGPDMLYVATRSASQGRKAGVVSSLAISAGGVFHTSAAALGLSALLRHSAAVFTFVKFAGAGYLIFLGVKTILNRSAEIESGRASMRPLTGVFRQGLIISTLNPKVALFFLSFLPQFADPQSSYFTLQIFFLGGVFITTGTIVNCLVALFSGSAGTWFRKKKTRSIGSWFSGLVYTALGAGLCFSDR